MRILRRAAAKGVMMPKLGSLAGAVVGVLLGICLMGAHLGVAVAGTAPTAASTSLAAAAPCETGSRLVSGFDQTDVDTQRGLRADVFAGSGFECRRSGSLIVIGPQNEPDDFQFYEFGWSLGHVCGRSSTNSSPLLYIKFSRIGEATFCAPLDGFSLARDSTNKLRASDINGNTVWGGYVDGTSIDPSELNLDFSSGQARTLAERYTLQDTNFNVFHDIQEYHDGNDWSQFDDVRMRKNTDPGFNFIRQSPNDHKVANP